MKANRAIPEAPRMRASEDPVFIAIHSWVYAIAYTPATSTTTPVKSWRASPSLTIRLLV